jgi:hypothetical protein
MIPPVDGWTFEVEDDAVFLRPLDDNAGVIRYVERRRPLVGFEELVQAYVCAWNGALARIVRQPTEALYTREGEYAALTGFSGVHQDGQPRQISIGYVLVDDFFAELIAVAAGEARFARFHRVARQLIASDAHMMTLRRRQYLHEPPTGWRLSRQGGGRNLIWRAPDHADTGLELVVAATVPLSSLTSAQLLASHHVPQIGLIVRRAHALPPPTLQTGLRGSVWRLEVDLPRAHERLRWIAMLQDAVHAYCLHLDGTDEEHLAIFERVLGSVMPLRPSSPTKALGEAALIPFDWITR